MLNLVVRIETARLYEVKGKQGRAAQSFRVPGTDSCKIKRQPHLNILSFSYTSSRMPTHSHTICKPVVTARLETHPTNINNTIYLFTAIGLLPGGSGYFTCKQNMKLVSTRFKSGGLHEKHVVATWNLGNHLSICLQVQGNQENPVSRWPIAGPSEYWLLASSPALKLKKKKQCTHSTTNTHNYKKPTVSQRKSMTIYKFHSNMSQLKIKKKTIIQRSNVSQYVIILTKTGINGLIFSANCMQHLL